jgi:NitT/TauT family transport system substrate-binding protein
MGLAAKGTKVPLKVAYAHYQRNPYRGCVLGKSDIKNWGDVAGKNVGLINLGQLSTKWYTEAAVREAGGDPAGLKFLPAGVHGPAGAILEKGAIDVYVSHHSHILQLGLLGFDVRTLPEPGFGGYNSFDGGMTVHQDMLANKDDRQALIGFFRAVAKGAVFSVENPKAATLIHFDLFPASIPKGTEFDKAVEETTRDYVSNLELTIPHGDPDYFGWQTKKRWEEVAYTEMQLPKDQIPDVSEFYTSDLIAEANDFDREAIRQQARAFTV